MTRRKQQRPIHVDNPEEGISSLNNAEMNNPNSEGNCSMEQENGDDISDPQTDTNPLPPDVHCAHIRTLQKQIRHAKSRIRHQQELIDIETFDQRDTNPAQLQSYIHAKKGGGAGLQREDGAAEPCILPATFNPEIRESNSKKPKPNETANKNSIKNLKTKELPENNRALNNPFSALNIEENSMEVADSDPNEGENRPKRSQTDHAPL
ncbi:hypothetical protein TNCT_673181 [Trichonephila clavata]|uniref:Uncharacterized protein n=1 Tax=Trichonephila clavata TaxID=2740835 RepID=A0A8X6HRG6_TRICU|nr:hypothetical protein TNCT_673181 [Trichonephila clavata]